MNDGKSQAFLLPVMELMYADSVIEMFLLLYHISQNFISKGEREIYKYFYSMNKHKDNPHSTLQIVLRHQTGKNVKPPNACWSICLASASMYVF